MIETNTKSTDVLTKPKIAAKELPSPYSACNPPRGFRPGPFPFHYQLNIVIDTLGELGWGRGHLAEHDDQDTRQVKLEGANPSEIAKAEDEAAGRIACCRRACDLFSVVATTPTGTTAAVAKRKKTSEARVGVSRGKMTMIPSLLWVP